MKDIIRKLIYIEPLDMDHFEGWLEEMARKGLLFERMSYWGVVFRRGEPAAIRYRLEPAGRLWTRESKDYCRELGWNYLGQAGQHFELYANPDPEAPELHTDPVVQSYALDLLGKRLRWYLGGLAALTLLLLAAVLFPSSPGRRRSPISQICACWSLTCLSWPKRYGPTSPSSGFVGSWQRACRPSGTVAGGGAWAGERSPSWWVWLCCSWSWDFWRPFLCPDLSAQLLKAREESP